MRIEDKLELRSADATDVSLPLAGIGARSYAFIIDLHIRAILALGWLAAVLCTYYVLVGSWWDQLVAQTGWSIWAYFAFLPTVAIYTLYHPVLEVAMKGRTPGKRKAGIRIVNNEGHTPGVGPLLVRNVFRLIDSLPTMYALGFVTMALTRRQLRIGDLAAGTVMIYEEATAQSFAELADTHRIRNLRQMELAEELLNRWRQLEVKRRSHLARELLSNFGVSSDTIQDAELADALRSIVNGGN